MSSPPPGDGATQLSPGVEVAYTYAWWLTGDDAPAAAAVEAALGAAAGSQRREELMAAVRAAVGGPIGMGSAAEIALLHDVAGLSLRAAATVAGVAESDAPVLLANGRLETLATPPDVQIEHPQRLGGLATGARRDTSHARLCASCRRLSELIAQGREELVTIAPVAVPAELAARLSPASMPGIPPVGPAPEEPSDQGTAKQSDAPEEGRGAVVVDEPRPDVSGQRQPDTEVAPSGEEAAKPETGREPVREGGAEVGAHDSAAAVVETPSDQADTTAETAETLPEAPESELIPPEVIELESSETTVATEDVAPADVANADVDVIAGPEDVEAPEPVAAPEEEAEEEEEEEEEPAPARAALLLVSIGVAVVVVGALLWVFRPQSDDVQPSDGQQSEPGIVASEVTGTEPEPQGTSAPSEQTDTPPSETTGGKGFQILDAGLIPPGEENIAPSGAVISATDPVVLAVDYKGAKGGVPLEAEWTVGGELYRVLSATLHGTSRHIFGEPVPAGGWPVGEHHIILTTEDGVVGSIDFTVE